MSTANLAGRRWASPDDAADAAVDAAVAPRPKPDGWHTYHICGGLLRELTFVSQADTEVAMCVACGDWFTGKVDKAS